nr:MAG TPA: hypothetical protein [Caudoviricetes sp.]
MTFFNNPRKPCGTRLPGVYIFLPFFKSLVPQGFAGLAV